jgi:6-pyruvoyltetrahydropterin/6-carboxytetrahydropterin synthase
MFELSKQFRFEAAHTLKRAVESEPSRRIHGHSYRAEVIISGDPDPDTGMLVDLGEVEARLEEVRADLDHRFLDEIADLGPATLENLSVWIWRRLAPSCPGIARVTVYRDSSGDACSYVGVADGRAEPVDLRPIAAAEGDR